MGVLATVLLAALAYVLLMALTASGLLALIAALAVLLAGIPTRGYGLGRRW